MAQSPIQPKKQDNRKRSKGGDWRQQGTGGGGGVGKFENGGRQYRGVRTPMPTKCYLIAVTFLVE